MKLMIGDCKSNANAMLLDEKIFYDFQATSLDGTMAPMTKHDLQNSVKKLTRYWQGQVYNSINQHLAQSILSDKEVQKS